MARTKIRAGDLRRRVIIQSLSESRDSIGAVVLTFATEATRWASINQLTARELEIHSRPEAVATHRIVLRHYPGLSVRQRITHKNQIFNLISVNDQAEGIHVTACIASEEVT